MANALRVLVVDDDKDLREALVEQLSLYDEFEVVSVDSATARRPRVAPVR